MMADRLLMAVSLLSLLGTLGLYAYSVQVRPVELTGPDFGAFLGRYVFVEGMVREVRSGWGGALRVELLPRGTPPGIWLYLDADGPWTPPFCNSLLTGAEVRVEGTLQEYNGMIEIALKSPHELRILSPSTLEKVWTRSGLLNDTFVSFAGNAFYKKVLRDQLSFRILDREDPSLEVNCSCALYRLSEEWPRWDNGTLVKVNGRLRFYGEPPAPRILLLAGAAGVEVL